MQFRKWFFTLGLGLIVSGIFAVSEAPAQCRSNSYYGGNYGSNYGYQNPSFYGQSALHPYQSSHYGSGYSSPSSYFPIAPMPPRPNPYASYYPTPTQPIYNTHNHYTDPRYDHHPWHPGHFLMGHY
jgi:hypothetical protein